MSSISFNTGIKTTDRFNRAERQQNDNQPSREKFKLVVKDHDEFNGTLISKIVTSTDFASQVVRMFRHVFNGVAGASINVDFATGIPFATVFFEYDANIKDTDYKKHAIEPVVSTEAPTTSYERLTRINEKFSTNQFRMSLAGKDVLEQFIPRNKRDQKGNVNWNNRNLGVYREVTDRPSQYMNIKPKIYIAVDIDLAVFAKVKYGETNNQGHKVDYAVSVARSYGITGGDYLLTIAQLDNKDLAAMASKIGMNAPIGGSIYMIRE